MKHRFRLIFICSAFCFYTGMNATFGGSTIDAMREKAAQAYEATCKKTRALYTTVKKHKKLIAGIVVYAAFELIGYSRDWDTPLQRLLIPKEVLDNVRAAINGHAAHIVNLTNAHRQELQEQQEAYQALERRYAEIQHQFQILQVQLDTDLRKQQVKKVMEEMAALKEQSVLILGKIDEFKAS